MNSKAETRFGNLMKGILAILAAAFMSTSAFAQWQTPNHSVPVGRGSGAGFKSFGPCNLGAPFIGAGASADPTCSLLTLPTTISAGDIMYGTSSNVIGSLAVGASGTIVRSNGTAPAYSTSTWPNTAGTSGTLLQSNGTGFTNTTATYPNSTTINQFLYSSAANQVVGLATANGGIVNTSATGVPSVTPTPTLGVNGVVGGKITLKGSNTGASDLRVAADAGSGAVFQLPVSLGSSSYILQTDGTGVTSWVPISGTISVKTTAGPFSVTTEAIIALNKTVASATSITLPTVASRNGAPLKIADFKGNAGDITITPNGAETIMGASSWVISSGGVVGSGGAVTLIPSTTLSGWIAE